MMMINRIIEKLRNKLRKNNTKQTPTKQPLGDLFYTQIEGRDTIDRIRDLSLFIAKNSMGHTLSDAMVEQVADVLFTYFCYGVSIASKDRGSSDDLKRAAFFTSIAKMVNNTGVVDSYIREEWKE